MKGWKEVNIKSISSRITSGGTPSTKCPEYYGGNIPWLNTKEVNFRVIESTENYITELGLGNSSAKWIEANSIIVAMYGATAGKCALTKIPLTTNQACCNITIDQKIADYKYIYYTLVDSYSELENMATGAAQQNLNAGMIAEFSILLPPLSEQKAIAAVLSSLDDKIDLLHRQNKTLEAMAETLFRQWFVEEADAEWEDVPLTFFGNIVCGKTPSKNVTEYFGENIPFIKIPDMHGNVFIFQTLDALTEKGRLSQDNKTLPPKSICISCIATVGLVSMNSVASQTNQQINSIIPRENHYRYFVFLLMKSSFDLLHAMASGGTATLNLNTGDFSNIPVQYPGEELLIHFNEEVEKIFNKIFCNQSQITSLEKLRDTLLPKLMSGEVRVYA